MCGLGGAGPFRGWTGALVGLRRAFASTRSVTSRCPLAESFYVSVKYQSKDKIPTLARTPTISPIPKKFRLRGDAWMYDWRLRGMLVRKSQCTGSGTLVRAGGGLRSLLFVDDAVLRSLLGLAVVLIEDG